MANTYTQLHIQFVFAVKYRAALINKIWNDKLHGYITGIVQNHEHKMLQINSMPDHIHIFIGMRPHQSVSALMQIVKSESTSWINENRFCALPFAWQKGYAAFSYAKSQVNNVIRYIQNRRCITAKKVSWMNTENSLPPSKLTGMNGSYLKNRNNTWRAYGTLNHRYANIYQC